MVSYVLLARRENRLGFYLFETVSARISRECSAPTAYVARPNGCLCCLGHGCASRCSGPRSTDVQLECFSAGTTYVSTPRRASQRTAVIAIANATVMQSCRNALNGGWEPVMSSSVSSIFISRCDIIKE